jgi:hypothetical protein
MTICENLKETRMVYVAGVLIFSSFLTILSQKKFSYHLNDHNFVLQIWQVFMVDMVQMSTEPALLLVDLLE